MRDMFEVEEPKYDLQNCYLKFFEDESKVRAIIKDGKRYRFIDVTDGHEYWGRVVGLVYDDGWCLDMVCEDKPEDRSGWVQETGELLLCILNIHYMECLGEM